MVLVYDGSSDDGTGIWQIFQRACCYHPVHGGGVVSVVLAFLMLFNLVLPWCCESFAWDQRYMSFLIHSPTILSLTQRRQKETSLHCCPKLTEIWNIDSKSFTFSIKVSVPSVYTYRNKKQSFTLKKQCTIRFFFSLGKNKHRCGKKGAGWGVRCSRFSSATPTDRWVLALSTGMDIP